jgi:hypothetical protein
MALIEVRGIRKCRWCHWKFDVEYFKANGTPEQKEKVNDDRCPDCGGTTYQLKSKNGKY